MTLHDAVSQPEEQQVVWEAFPSWAHFTWLYLLSAVSALRGALFFRFGMDGWVGDVDRWGWDPSRLCRNTTTLGALRAHEGSDDSAEWLYKARDPIHLIE